LDEEVGIVREREVGDRGRTGARSRSVGEQLGSTSRGADVERVGRAGVEGRVARTFWLTIIAPAGRVPMTTPVPIALSFQFTRLRM
jgi:hypothetical protein